MSKILCSVLVTFALVSQITLVRGTAQIPKYLGCDFDLIEQQPSIIEYLSDECKTLSVNQESDEYKILLQEAHAFANFHKKLSQYEQQKDPNGTIGDGIPEKQWALRNEIYSKNNFFQCIKSKSILKDIMICMINLRKNMSDSIVLEN